MPRTIERLEKALAAEQAANKAKSDLLAVVSHELRTPMGAVISMAELLATTPLDATQRHYTETMQHSARGLLTVLNDILDYSKLEAEKFELEPIPFDFQSLMRDLAAELAARADEKRIKSAVDVAEGCPAWILGDPVRIRQILNNLIGNAVKFTHQGAVRVRVECAEEPDGLKLSFIVSDTGIGMSDSQRMGLFEPYAQADRSVAVKYGGTGLGLSIAGRLVALMDGDIECQSREGDGTVFRFSIRAGAAEGIAGEAAAAGVDGAFGPLNGHVLIAEDNTVNQMLIGAFLDRFGLTHDMVANGREAVDAAAAHRYDAVLMDVMMPEMDGLEATRMIRASAGPEAEMPIVALTANAMKGDRETYLAAGMDGYVSKPISAKDLFAAIAGYMGRGEGDAEGQAVRAKA